MNKKTSTPTLLEIEQLELILSFRSMIPNSQTPSMFKEGFRTFDVTNNLDVGTRTTEKSIKNLTIGNFSLNAELGQMELSGTAISLTPTEFLLMHALASSSGAPVSPATLVSFCWEEGTRPSERALDVAIFRLRKKLKNIMANTSLIKTVRGSGYMFDMSSIKVDSAAAAL
ncbi:MAG: winged helix-turn-helix domain-containing protein [SAR202 cluster bacterium]|nr:winged helix-turn-helix domain-containing protein [SAR202 cluster bacterium]